ncbi:hypothetical protein A9Q91_05810 [Candidatus Gracilibacteria bacterium 28_42_T64]|nr:hypothetical protein A9Q91_05810 [Candidatus Gracilibacteria bacterium 28_42_T64]
MEKIKKVLEKVGLSQNEINVYLTSLSIGQSTASIIGQKIGLNRSTARYTCQSLVSKRIMSMIPKKDYYLFSAEDPEKLLSILNKEYSLIDNKVRDLQQIMGDLKGLINPQASIPKVKYYQGVDGVIELLEDTLEEGKEIYGAIKIDNNMNPKIKKYIKDTYIPLRKSSNFNSYGLFNDNDETKSYKKLDKEINRFSMLVPEEFFPFPASFHIYGNKVSFYSFYENEITGIIIENQHIHDTQLSMFKLGWEMAKQYSINNEYKNINL